jgi:hypothetical protein
MALEDFLSSNIVITKGENRHPSADVYHQYLEGLIEAEPSMYSGDKAPYYCEPPKSCENCKYFRSNHIFGRTNGCRVPITPSSFYCNEHVPKEIK